MKLSILIVSYNVRPLLERCLKSLELIQGLHFEVIVVDNDSQDGTKEFLENVNMPHRQSAGEAETQNEGNFVR